MQINPLCTQNDTQIYVMEIQIVSLEPKESACISKMRSLLTRSYPPKINPNETSIVG